MIKKITIEHDSSPVSHLEDIESLLKSFGVVYNTEEYDGGVRVVYDPDYKNIEDSFKEASENAKDLSKNVVQYAKALFELQPKILEGFNNGRICGPKEKWTFEECVHEAVMVMYKHQFGGFMEPMIVGTSGVEIQSVWNEENNYKRNHAQ